MMTKDEALKLALEALKTIDEAMPFPVAKLAQAAIKEALAQPEQEPVAWLHRFIEGGISIGLKPADLERHPERWEPLYTEPKPCSTCEALARTVMLDQTSHDTTPPQRPSRSDIKPLTDEDIDELSRSMVKGDKSLNWLCRAIERKHGIKGEA